MPVMNNKDPADASAHEPRVTGAPDAIWLVYGDLERDDTHAECRASGEVTWCEHAQFAADVQYTRTDLVAERVHAAVAAERKRCADAIRVAANGCALADNRAYVERFRATLLSEIEGTNAQAEPDPTARRKDDEQ